MSIHRQSVSCGRCLADQSTTSARSVVNLSTRLIVTGLTLGFDGKTLRMYVPPGQWYDWYTLEEVLTTPEYITVDTPLDYMPVSNYVPSLFNFTN